MGNLHKLEIVDSWWWLEEEEEEEARYKRRSNEPLKKAYFNKLKYLNSKILITKKS